MASRISPTSGPIPKPPPRRKWRRPLARAGQGTTDWETYRQEVFYPMMFLTGVIRGLVAEDGTLIVACSEPGCRVEGQLTLLRKPNSRGHFWHCEGMEVDHIEPRSHEPGKRFSLANCRWLCHAHNTAKGGSHVPHS